MTRTRELVATLVVALVYVVVLARTAPDIGFVRDEGYYFKAAREYVGWFPELVSDPQQAVRAPTIDRYFSYNHEHPALVKVVQGGLHALLHERWGLTSSAQGFRAAGFLYAALALLGTFVLGRQIAGPGAGVLAALFLTAMPRFFFDAHLACFDVPITAMWTWSLAAFLWLWTAPPSRVAPRTLGTGVVFGLAIATKLNALFLPFIFVAVWLLGPPGRWWPRRTVGEDGRAGLQLGALPWSLIGVAIVGVAVFFASWPWLWPDPVGRVLEYLRFHAQHEHYPISYFGELYVKPPFPWSFPWVMTALTVPTPILLLGALGLAARLPDLLRRRPDAVVLLLGTLLPIFLISLPSTPIFGGTKHWYNALPTLSIAAAAVVSAGARELMAAAVRRRGQTSGATPGPGRIAPALAGALTITFCLPGWLGAARVHPNGIGFYNELAGGVRGAAELGMQRSFWGYVPYPLYPSLDRWADRGRVFFNRTNYDSFRQYRTDGLIPSGISYANSAQHAHLGLVFEQPEHGETEAEIWANLGTRPVAGVYQDEVTLGQLYVESWSGQAPPATAQCAVPPPLGASSGPSGENGESMASDAGP